MKRGMSFARRPSGSSLDLLSNLILSLDLEEASGNAIDSSGNGYDFTDTNTVGQTTGATAGYNSRQFTSANTEYFTRPNSTTELTIGNNEWAAHMWVYGDSAASNAVIFAKANTGGALGTTATRSFALSHTVLDVSFQAGLVPETSGTAAATTTGDQVPNATWVPILIWHDPTGDVIGVKVGPNSAVTAAISTGVRDGSANVTIGSGSAAGGVEFNGSVAALRIWRGSGVIAQIVSNTDALAFLNAQQRRHSELT